VGGDGASVVTLIALVVTLSFLYNACATHFRAFWKEAFVVGRFGLTLEGLWEHPRVMRSVQNNEDGQACHETS
jgi:hypothetical protein